MSIIGRMIEKIYGRPEVRVLLLGLDAAGRTTTLYKLKLGEIVTTIPTIGFNVETVTHGGTSFTMWDVGGCDKIRPLWRHYFQNTQALIWFAHSSDRDRVDEAREEIQRLLSEEVLQDVPFLVWATKQDLPNVMTPEEVSSKLALQNLDRPWACIGCSAFTGEGLYEGLQWIQDALRAKRGSGRKEAGPARAPPELSTKEKEMEALLQQWLEQEDEPDDEFLDKFRTYTLDSWDHRTHLRIAWLYLTREGRREGMRLIFEGIKAFIANSPRTKRARGTTFHETMTYFWVHMVHYALATTSNPDGGFKTFLLLNPQLANGGMFLAYYSKKLMLHTPEARTSVVLPDKAPLPSLVSDVRERSSALEKTAGISPAAESSSTGSAVHASENDADFLARFEGGQLDRWNHECLIRVIFLYLITLGRAQGKEKILTELRRHEGSGFHMTINYFWIQMVDFARATWQKSRQGGPAPGGVRTKKDMAAASGLVRIGGVDGDGRECSAGGEFGAFKSWCQGWKAGEGILTNSRLYLDHYREKSIFDTSAAEVFRLPDLKPLPSLVG
ncbi:GTP-binding ADP-ribosylation factor [Klebsormidium nitens]|uniref:GTP-binding ADP-ribosylation factor n=1 Tax=Klebsormidium nitens TaxID=105231 RepID=A0A1Y1I4T0_KLENI|nr:GTP-binding ADP-ribosylation factor [Klebsormidium nitens]|eukprot:GAQ85950.1 GTP-binding ADP-ribosylation factor [Klebsormidium nitens]